MNEIDIIWALAVGALILCAVLAIEIWARDIIDQQNNQDKDK